MEYAAPSAPGAQGGYAFNHDGQTQYPPFSPNGRAQPDNASNRRSISKLADNEPRLLPEQQPVPPYAGLPQSQSTNTLGNFIGPNDTPSQLGVGSHGFQMASGDNRFTEPRNHTTPSRIEPFPMMSPPRYGLPVNSSSYQTSPADPFAPGPAPTNSWTETALVLHQRQPQEFTSRALVPYQGNPQTDLVHPMISAHRSHELNRLTQTPTGLPNIEDAIDPTNFPFVEGGTLHYRFTRGVLRFGNIPYNTSRKDLLPLLGKNARLVNDSEEPIHIIMDRATGKTMDAFAVFLTSDDAIKAAERFHQSKKIGKPASLEKRPLEVELSSHGQLMQDLFPLAAGVRWGGPEPTFLPISKWPWKNFRGFVFPEEMAMLVKHAEMPHSTRCAERPYECLISTLHLFPWSMTACITVRQRMAIYSATTDLLQILARRIERGQDADKLHYQLYHRVVHAAMSCPGFTVVQKDNIAYMAALDDVSQRQYSQPRFPSSWVHPLALVPKPGTPLDVIEWYIAIIREQTIRDVQTFSITERAQLQKMSEDTDMYWGYFFNELGHKLGPEFDTMTLHQLALMEFGAIERILRRALPSAHRRLLH